MTSNRPSGAGPHFITTQAHRAWLRSACPSGTKATLPSKRLRISRVETLIQSLGSVPQPLLWGKDCRRNLLTNLQTEPSFGKKEEPCRGKTPPPQGPLNNNLIIRHAQVANRVTANRRAFARLPVPVYFVFNSSRSSRSAATQSEVSSP
jgi:hypothetical protein